MVRNKSNLDYSIIIPVLNEADTIKDCLLALQSFTQQSEIIVVDGGSTDNTLGLAKPFANKVICSAKGRAKQMNAGAKLAKGNMLIFLHADTFLPKNALSLIPLDNIAWGRFDITLKSQSNLLLIVATLMNWRSRLTAIATGDQAIFVSKSLFKHIGGYPEIALMEDIALCNLLKNMAPPICLTEKVSSSARRWEQFGIFKTILLMWSLRLRYYFGEKPETLATLYSRGLFWKTSFD